MFPVLGCHGVAFLERCGSDYEVSDLDPSPSLPQPGEYLRRKHRCFFGKGEYSESRPETLNNGEVRLSLPILESSKKQFEQVHNRRRKRDSVVKYWLGSIYETRTMYGSKARLIYSASKLDFKDVVNLVKRNAGVSNIELEVHDADRLTSSDEERFLEDVRMIPPQIRGQVRSGGGRTLPITGSSKLNHSIPILIVYDGIKPVDVYPKDLMGVKHDLSSAFKIPSPSDRLGVESNLVTILSSKPELLGPGLQLVHREFETGSGVIDMIFKDAAGVFLSVEVKEEADQETVGQVLKQSNGLRDKLGSSSFRKAIVALRTSGYVRAACKAGGIELYLIAAQKLA